MNKLVLSLVLCVAAALAVKQVYVTDNRQAQVSISRCDGCTCEYYSFVAVEQDTKSKTDHTHTNDLWFYYNHQLYDSCASTYQNEYVSILTPFMGLKINQAGKSARINMTDLVDNMGNTISFDFHLYDIDSVSNCKCRYSEQIGVNGYSQTSDSNYIRTGVTGSLTRNAVPQNIDGAVGYIYSYGSKTIIINN